MAVDWTQVIVATVTGVPAIVGAVGALWAAAKAREAKAGVDEVGKQVGRHVYEQRDRDSTLMERLGSTQRAAEAAAMKPANAIPEETVSGYRRRAKAAAEELEGLVQQAKMVMGHTPTERIPVTGFTGKVPPPPPVPPIKDDDD